MYERIIKMDSWSFGICMALLGIACAALFGLGIPHAVRKDIAATDQRNEEKLAQEMLRRRVKKHHEYWMLSNQFDREEVLGYGQQKR